MRSIGFPFQNFGSPGLRAFFLLFLLTCINNLYRFGIPTFSCVWYSPFSVLFLRHISCIIFPIFSTSSTSSVYPFFPRVFLLLVICAIFPFFSLLNFSFSTLLPSFYSPFFSFPPPLFFLFFFLFFLSLSFSLFSQISLYLFSLPPPPLIIFSPFSFFFLLFFLFFPPPPFFPPFFPFFSPFFPLPFLLPVFSNFSLFIFAAPPPPLIIFYPTSIF